MESVRGARFGNNWLAQVGYTGTRGYHLQMGRFNVNNPQDLPQGLLDQWRSAYISSNGVDPGQSLVPNPFQPNPNQLIPFQGRLGTSTMQLRETLFPFPFFPGNLLGAPIGFQTYHALMAQVNRSFSNGLSFNVHYTWSRALEMWGSEAQNNNFGENAGLQTFNLDRANWATTTSSPRTISPTGLSAHGSGSRSSART